MLRVSGSFWVKKPTKKSLLAGLPAAIPNIKRLDEAGKMVSQDMLMRRFSRIIAQRKRQSLLLPTPISSTSSNYNVGLEQRSKKRGRTMSVVTAKVSNSPVESIPSPKRKRISGAATKNVAEGSRSAGTSTRISSLRSKNTPNRTATASSGRMMAIKRTTDDAAPEPSGSKKSTRTKTTILSLATTGSKIAKSGKSPRNNPTPPPTSSASRYSLRDRSKLSSPKKMKAKTKSPMVKEVAQRNSARKS